MRYWNPFRCFFRKLRAAQCAPAQRVAAEMRAFTRYGGVPVPVRADAQQIQKWAEMLDPQEEGRET